MRSRAPLLAALLVLACRADRVAPVEAEFLMLAADSTFWVTSGPAQIRVRGSPIQLARFGGSFYELYVGDDDRSFYDAVIVGQRIFRRDLVTGDSTAIFEDTTIADFAHWYEREHPDDRRLNPNDESADEPHVSATSEVRILSHHGPFLSYEYRANGEIVGSETWHIARRGVVDMRTGRVAPLEEIVGDTTARRVRAQGRQYFRQAVDSVLASRDARARPAIEAIGNFEFDSASFALVNVNRALAVEFLVPGRRGDAEGLSLPLSLISVPAPPWWREIVESLPSSQDSGGSTDRWRRPGFQVVAGYDAIPERARITLVDTLGHEWPVARVPAPVWRIYWLDTATDTTTRRALARAFDDAALYDPDARTTWQTLPRRAPRLVVAQAPIARTR